MAPIARALLAFGASLFRSRMSLQLEIVARRHQLTLYQRAIRRPRVRPIDRILWSWLARGGHGGGRPWSSSSRRPRSLGSAHAFGSTRPASAEGTRAGRRSARNSGR